jgi:cytochrome c-type biogenesis protein
VEALAATFVLGMASVASPCLLPLYPGFVAYLAASRQQGPPQRAAAFLGLAVLAGLLTTMIGIGVVVAMLALPLGDVLEVTVPLTSVVLVILGILLLAGRNPFVRLAGVRLPVVAAPLGQAYVYGLIAGPVAMPCAGPFFIALLAISIGLADTALRVGTFIAYGLGFGLPLVLLAAVGSVRSESIARFLARRHGPILRVMGALLIGTAVYQLVYLL